VDLFQEFRRNITRRHFFAQGSNVIGWAALASLLGTSPDLAADSAASPADSRSTAKKFPPKAKHIIYLHMVGGPPQVDLFDYKPVMREWFDKNLPESIRMGQRLTTMTSGQSRFPVAPSTFKFEQHGESRMWVSEVLPWTAKMVDDLCFVRSMHTEAINHEPAITFIQTGSMIAGKPCFGAWTAYGLGTMNKDLPTFVVLNATHSHPKAGVQAISAKLWSAGFLSAKYAGVALRSSGDPVLYINNPDGVDGQVRRRMLDTLGELNEMQFKEVGDPETQARIAQYEMAFRMQSSVPELTNISGESKATLDLYGPEVTIPGTFSHSALMARRLAERGVRCIEIFHREWDHHTDLPRDLPLQCRDVDHACMGLIKDLKSRGMLDETLVVWGGEFGRTVYCQGKLTKTDYGRDHHPRCFTMWMAGGGVKGGLVHGETDEFSYNVVKDPVHIRDINATILHCMGIDHERLTYKFQGLDAKLTGVESAEVVKPLLA
jgi:hypothetical protein